MPVYEYNCPRCGVFERVCKVENHKNKVVCNCGTLSNQIITKVTTFVPASMRWDFDPYESPSTGNIISTQKQRNADLANSGCIEWEPGMKQDKERMIATKEKDLDSKVDRSVDKALNNMSADTIESLGRGIESGLDLNITKGEL